MSQAECSKLAAHCSLSYPLRPCHHSHYHYLVASTLHRTYSLCVCVFNTSVLLFLRACLVSPSTSWLLLPNLRIISLSHAFSSFSCASTPICADSSSRARSSWRSPSQRRHSLSFTATPQAKLTSRLPHRLFSLPVFVVTSSIQPCLSP